MKTWQVLIKDKATVRDTVNLIRNTVNKYAHGKFVQRVAAYLKNKYHDPESLIRGLFEMIDGEIIYTRDPEGHEKVMTPKRFFQERKGDCKKFSTFIAAVLKALGFKPVLKVVSYDGVYWAHIYVILPNGKGKYLTLDPVNNHQYDREVKYKKATVHFLNGVDMKLSLLGRPPLTNSGKAIDLSAAIEKMAPSQRRKNLNSISAVADDLMGDLSELAGCAVNTKLDNLRGLSGPEQVQMMNLLGLAEEDLSGEEMLFGLYGDDDLGKKKKGDKKKRKGKVWGFMKKIGLAPSRASFLLLVRTNIFGIARKLDKALKAGKTGALKFWKKLGGNPAKLKKAVDKGKNFLKKKSKRIAGLAGDELQSELEGLGFPPAIAAAIAAATPLVVGVIKALKKDGAVSATDPEDVTLLKNADQAEQHLEQKIDNGQADQYVQRIQQVQQASPAPAALQDTDSGESFEGEAEQVEGIGSLEGLGKINIANIINTIAQVIKPKAPKVSAAVNAVRAINTAATQVQSPQTKAYLNNQAATAAALIKKSQSIPVGDPLRKKTANQLKIVLENTGAQVQAAAVQQAKAGSFLDSSWVNLKDPMTWIGWHLKFAVLWCAGGREHVYSMYDFITNLF